MILMPDNVSEKGNVGGEKRQARAQAPDIQMSL